MIYLDNASTTAVYDEVADLVVKYMKHAFGNASSLHRLGLDAEKAVKNAKALISKLLNCHPSQVVFNSGATEGNNTIILGTAFSRSKFGKHLITSAIEHPSVLACFDYLADQGFDVTILPVNAKGCIDVQTLLEAIRPDTQLVSMMMVNNETGHTLPIKTYTEALKAAGYQGLFHTDATQAIGKLSVNLKDLSVDFLTGSAHKFHGPKGVGFVYVSNQKHFTPLLHGGGQEQGRRSGTTNTPGVVGMAKAMAISLDHMKAHYSRVVDMNRRIREALAHFNQDVLIVSPEPPLGVPHIIDVAFKGIKSEVLLHSLENHGIMVSSGSACSTNKNLAYSHVLMALEVPQAFIDGAIRISLSYQTKAKDVEDMLQILIKLIPELQTVTRKRI